MPVFLAAALLAAAPASLATDVGQLVDRFNAARTAFDDRSLAATLAPDFQEISPVGDVDSRDQVIGFYRADQRKPVPTMTSSERSVALHRDWALVTERVSFDMAKPDGTTVTRSLRVRYVAVKAGAGWQLASAQYTGIPNR
ncbi:nuclear transport factor 2 family protein [Sphingomonas sp. MA1305]|uniref:nuclear transport factor 2 family protein n=1 Tax=Sphingomonas sp. MA1305 TaxID=2479204 RepID=UPI0018DF3ED9|nr:nuclear transport factor 2 family protein [Sphingomonas sp. MA1305]MBI0475532.1 nuclear transport factor 2 family protein [Sphingomonas sp. MA1305]